MRNINRCPSGWTTRLKVLLIAVVFLTAGAVSAEENPGPEAGQQMLQQAVDLFDQGSFQESALSFAAAADLLAGSLFDDDARYGYLRAQEAGGVDELADTRWQQWLVENPGSTLRVQAELDRAWSLVRQGKIQTAQAMVDALESGEPWLASDPRLLTLKAATAYLREDWQQAVLNLENARQAGPLAPSGLMLEGMCQTKLGQDYAAAVAFQQLIDEYPGSRLVGYAYLAKAEIFPGRENYRLAAVNFGRAAERTTRPDHRAEARFLAAATEFLSGQEQQGLEHMRAVAVDHSGSDLAARALFSMGEMRWQQGNYEQAIVRFNEVLSGYFAHELAGSALYRTGRCLDALGRTVEANSTYQAVAQGHPYSQEAPAAVYLAGVGLYEQGKYLDAAPYFQLILDRYAGSGQSFVFASAQHQELVEASLCLLEFSFHQAGEVGLMAGAPHIALQKMPPSDSLWRAYTLLLDADALAAVDRFAESQETLSTLLREFPDHPVGIRANRLLAWTYASQDRQDLAIATEAALLARYDAQDDQENLAGALLTIAHGHFNAKRYMEAATSYEEFISRYQDHPKILTALYQAGICYVRTGRAGDAVDRWQVITDRAPGSEEARKAWLRSGDILFQAGQFEQARLRFTSLMQHFSDPESQASGLLRLGRCDYNAGQGVQALARFRQVVQQFPTSSEAVEAGQGITNILYTMGLAGESKYLRELVEQFPTSPLAPEAGFQLAWELYQDQKYDEAAEAFQDLCGRYPRSSAADRNFFYRADALLKSGRDNQARESWEKFLTYFPHSELASAALLNLGNLQFNAGQYHGAIEDFQQALALGTDPDVESAARYNLAMSQRIIGNSDQAMAALEQYSAAVALEDPRLVEVHRNLGVLNQESGHLREAARQYQKAIELGAAPELAVELNYLAGACLKEAGDIQAALGAYAQSIAGEDKNNNFRLSALAQTADIYEQEGDFKAALSAYRDLAQNATDPALAGAAKERLNQLEAALGR